MGLAAIQIVKSAGAVAVATTRGWAKKQFLLDAGADHVIVTDESDLAEQTMAVTDGRGADILFDPVAGPFLEKLAQAAAPGATIFEYGALSPAPTPFPMVISMKSVRPGDHPGSRSRPPINRIEGVTDRSPALRSTVGEATQPEQRGPDR